MRSLHREWRRFALALRYFTRLPCPSAGRYRAAHVPRTLPYFPWVGLIVGGLSAGAYLVASTLFASASLAALCALATHLIVTGAFHEDGLADTVDGFGGGYDTIRVLAIMKDSRVGTFGAVALWLALTLQWQALTLLGSAHGVFAVCSALVAAHAAARFIVLIPMTRLPYLRSADGSKAYPFAAAKLTRGEWAKAGLAIVLPLAALPLAVASGMIAGIGLGAGYWIWRTDKRLGGFTGDVLGAIESTAFTTGLLGILCAWNSI
ncbi:adenosylcobinamide-GDP ribazoletransferase [Hydrogenophilus thermoluteolus]|uniref:adenosylcobinamide-GDP ribazoletransferase n=1 Tax=Hydrogenophilus thermoluteolus TaxID=297 RepID=UPI003F6741D7